MTRRELATVLAALRYWQHETEYRIEEIPSQIIDVATDGDTLEVLSTAEVDALASRLQAGEA